MKERKGFDAASFQCDWNAQKAICPTGRERSSWAPAIDRRDNEGIKIKFSTKDCRQCPMKSHGTTAPRRAISLRTQEHHQALQEVRTRQKDDAFGETYRARSGIEGTISQGVRAFGVRQSRYRGREKTHFQHLICATAMNFIRVLDWLDEKSLAKTRLSRCAALQLVA